MINNTLLGSKLKFDYIRTTLTKESARGSRLVYDCVLSSANQPSKILANGDQWWYLNGKVHRDDGPAVITGKYEMWMQNGTGHRDGNQPAIIRVNGDKEYIVRGQRHRTDGPALEYKNNPQKNEYWVDGVQMTRE